MDTDDLLSRDGVGYLNNDHTRWVSYSQSTSDRSDIQIRIADISASPKDVLLQPEYALKLLAWLEKERETIQRLAEVGHDGN